MLEMVFPRGNCCNFRDGACIKNGKRENQLVIQSLLGGPKPHVRGTIGIAARKRTRRDPTIQVKICTSRIVPSLKEKGAESGPSEFH